LHDLNGLWALRRHGLSLTVLLVNNDGGGIFHFLPQAEHAPDQFEQWFGTPHGLDFRHAVELHGGAHRVVAHGELEAALRQAIAAKGLQVVELRTDRERNVALHRRMWARVDAALREAAAADPALAPMLPAAPVRAKR
jgi:2-succinyl-5-enolpyruvyl-6-hydroxy-3-cyclohexene-1-carboxylate synthase